jgi:hypothetical protein
VPSTPSRLLPTFTHPVVLVDPRPVSVLLLRRLRGLGVPIGVLTSRRLEPAFYARGVRRAFLPGLDVRPEAWIARLLEWAAHLEPRPLVWPCSWSALQRLLEARDNLAPHYEIANADTLVITRIGTSPPADVALRRAILRSEPAFEIQLTLDRAARVTGACALAWSPGAAPDVVVASVKADDLVERSHHWLADQDYHGYVRLIWSPDRFGHLALQAASPFPGIGLAFALQDGVDFSRLAYASITGMSAAPETARGGLVRRVSIVEPGVSGENLPLVEYWPSWSAQDPVPWCVGVIAQLVRR